MGILSKDSDPLPKLQIIFIDATKQGDSPQSDCIHYSWNRVIMRTLRLWGLPLSGVSFVRVGKLYNMLSFVVGKFLLYLSSL